MPVGEGVVEAEFDVVTVAGVGELGDDVFAVGGEVDDVVVGGFGVEEAEAVVVLGGENDVFHAGLLGEEHDGVGVEVGGVKLMGHGFVLVDGDAGVIHDLLAVEGDLLAVPDAAEMGVDSEVDEEAEMVVFPFLECGLCRLVGVGWCLLTVAGGGQKGGCDEKGEKMFHGLFAVGFV